MSDRQYSRLRGTTIEVPRDVQIDIYKELDRLGFALGVDEDLRGHAPSAAAYDALPGIIRWAITQKCKADPALAKKMQGYFPSLWLVERIKAASPASKGDTHV
jgi:hypothetical protein